MLGGELVEQAALHVRAGQPVQFLLLLVADQAVQLVEALQAERLGEIVVDLGLRRRVLTAFTVTANIAALPLSLSDG